MAKKSVWLKLAERIGGRTPAAPIRRPRASLQVLPLDDRIVPTQLAYGLFDTGVNNTGGIVTGGPDAHYTLPVTLQGTTGETATILAKNVGESIGTGYINPTGATTSPAGIYEYQTTFTVPAGTNLANATLSGLYGVGPNDTLTAADLNATVTSPNISGTTSGGTPFSLTGLQVGTNTLTFTVTHTGTALTEIKTADLVLNVAPPAGQQPPSITGSGNTASPVVGGPAVAVDPGVTVSDPSGANLTTASVSISANQTAGDVLAFTPVGAITGSYNAASGILTLSGSDTAANYQTALQSVTIQVTAAGAGPRTVSFSIAPGQYDPANGHFYQFVTSNGINWGAAEAAASGSSIFGLQGYLATPRNAAENNFAFSKVGAQRAWLGMSDSFTEDWWQRVTGPDTGVHFFQQTAGGDGGTAVGGLYNNWDPGTPEPNNSGGDEDYAHFLPSGLWNDYRQDTNVAGYIVEYGGSPNDPTLQITSQAAADPVPQSAAPTVTAPAAAATVSAATYTVTGTAPAGSLVKIYNDQNGNGAIDPGDQVVATVQLAAGQTAYSVPVPLAANAVNHFTATATAPGDGESAPVAVPALTDQTAVQFTSGAETVAATAGTFSIPVTLTGTPLETPTTFATGFNGPGPLVFDAAGNLYVPNSLGTTVNKVTPAGVVSTFATGFQDPVGLAFDSAGNLYVANSSGTTVSKVTPAGVSSTFVSGLQSPGGLSFDAAGNLYVANTAANTVLKVTPAGVVSTLASGFNNDTRVLVGPDGDVYVTNENGTTISRVTPAGVVSTFADGLNHPDGLAFDAAGNLYVANYGVGGNGTTVSEVSPLGVVSTFASGLIGPDGLAFDSAGTLYASNYSPTNTVVKLGPGTVSVPFTLGGTATAGTDYTGLTASPLSFAPGATTATITGNLVVDPGADQTLTFTLGTPSDGVADGTPAANTLTITEPAPTLTAVSPAAVPAGSPDTTITLTGTNFGPTSVADLNGTPLTTTFVNSTTLTAVVPTADLATAGASDTVSVANANGTTSGGQPFTVGPAVAVGPSALPNPTNGQAYNQTLTAANGTGPYTFALSGGTALPAGLTLNATTGVISGIPTADGSTTFTVTATDANGAPGSQQYTLVVSDPLAVTTTAIAPVSDGVSYTQPIATTGGRGPNAFTVSSGALPAGLTLDPASGIISGTPTTDGPFTFAVTATDADGRVATSPTFAGTVTEPLAVTTTAIAPVSSGVSYNQPITTTGGQTPDTFAVSSGALPAGLTLDPATGVISGTPTANGPFSFAVTATDAAGRTAASPTFVGTVTDPLAVTPTTLAPTTDGAPFTQTEAATGGQAPDTFAVTAGALPAGLSLNPTTGVISGTPTTDGPVSFTVTATDSVGRTAAEPYTGTVVEPLAVTTTAIPPASNGQPYSASIATTGGRGPVTFAVSGGALPAGLSLDPATGVVSGTPTTDGPFSFAVTATDADGRSAGSPTFTGTVTDPLVVGPATLPTATTGQPLAQTETATGGMQPDTFAVTAGALPAGLTLDPATGAITGTPTTAGPFAFTVTATDAAGRTASQAYAGAVADPLAIPPITAGPATNGAAYSTPPLTATGGTQPVTFAVTAGTLPAGLTLDPATGAIVGTPTADGSYTFTVTATDAAGRTASQTATVAVADPVAFGGSGTLPDGTTGVGLSDALAAAGGAAPLTYAVTAGALPPGTALDPNTGLLSGTPTAPGTYTFTVTATDAAGRTGSQVETLTIDSPLSFGGSGTLPGGTAQAPYSQAIAVTGGSQPVTFAISAGTLPAGLTLDPATGAVTGTPTAPGTYTFTVTATDELGRTASQVETVTLTTGSNLSPEYAVAAGNGGGARVEVYDRSTGALLANFFAFEPAFRGGANVVVGDVNGDGVPDVVVAAGVGGGARIEVIDGTKLNDVDANGEIDPSAVLANFFAFDSTLRGGVTVALARLDTGKGLDIVAGAGVGGGPAVRTFAYTPGAAGGVTQLPGAIGSFFAFDPSQRFGVAVAAGNLDGTGTDDVIVGEGVGAAPTVAVFRADGTLRNEFTASDLAPAGGVSVAAGYLDGTTSAQLVLGTGPGGPPTVDIYTGTSSTPERSVQAFDPSFLGGVSVNSGPVGQQSAIFLGAGAGGGPRVKVLTANGVTELFDFYAYEPTFTGGVNVG